MQDSKVQRSAVKQERCKLLKDHSWRIAFLKQKTAKLLGRLFSATRTCCNVVPRHLAKFSSGIFNLWCRITLSQTLNQLLPPHIEIQMRILISQPDKKIEMLMIYWRQEVYKHRWFAPAQTRLEAPTADCGAGRGTRAHLPLPPRQLWSGGGRHPHRTAEGREDASKQNQETAHLPFHDRGFGSRPNAPRRSHGEALGDRGVLLFWNKKIKKCKSMKEEKSNTFGI